MKARRMLKALLGLADLAYDGLLALLFRAIRAKPRSATVAIVRVDRIGDLILWLPAAHRIVEACRGRGYRVVLIVAAECAELARGIAGVGEVLAVDRDALRINPAYRAGFLARVARLGAEVALQPAFSRIPSLGDAIVRFTRARRRIGWAGDAANTTRLEKRLGDRAYTELFPNPSADTAELTRNERLLDHLGIAAVPVGDVPLPRRTFAHPAPGNRYFVLAPGASRGLRQWPIPGFAEIATRLHRQMGWVAVVCGGTGDGRLAAMLARSVPAPIVDLTGRTALDELADVIAGADLVLSNDSAAVHVAAAMKVPCVCISGGGQYGRFIPYPSSRLASYRPPRVVAHAMPCYGCNWSCRYRRDMRQPAPCIEGVSTEAVWAAVVACLAEEGARGTPPGHDTSVPAPGRQA